MHDISLRKHRGFFVAVWYDETGHRQRRSLGTQDRSIANTRIIAFRAQLTKQAPAGPMTVGAIYAAYIKDREEEGKSVERIKNAWKRLGPTFADHRPDDITKPDCNAYIATRRAAEISDGTIWTELGYLRVALGFAVRKGWLQTLPYIKLPQKPGPREHHLTREEARRLIECAVMPHVKLFIILALATAGRASALLELTWVRVDLDARRVYLRNPERDATPKGRATVPINDMLLVALQEAGIAALSPYVIEWGGERVMSVKKGVGAAARRAGVKCSPHVLRHTAAVWMAEDGVPMAKIAQYLGHSNDKVTQRVYARFSPEFMKDAAAALEL
jgi:integrase